MSNKTPKVAGIEMLPMPGSGDVPEESLYVYNARKNSFEFVVCVEHLYSPWCGPRWQPTAPDERYSEQELRCFFTHFIPKKKVDERISEDFGHRILIIPEKYHQPLENILEAMTRKLFLRESNKDHWSQESFNSLFLSMKLEKLEALEAVYYQESADQIIEECADIANYAMMIADNATRLPSKEENAND